MKLYKYRYPISMLMLAVFIEPGGKTGWSRLRMAFLKHAKESFQELKKCE